MAFFCCLVLTCCFTIAKPVKNGGAATVNHFIAALNKHDVKEIYALLSEDHLFIDAGGQQVSGAEKVLAGWKGYFDWFPDYTIEVEQLFINGDTAALFGYASGTFAKADTAGHWRIPASWKAVVHEGKIKSWQMFADTRLTSEILNRYSGAGGNDKLQGFGGVFFKSEHPKELKAWYDTHLGTTFGTMGFSLFWWRDYETKQGASTSFSIFKASSDYFNPSNSPFMFNFRVGDLEATLNRLKAEGVTVVGDIQSFDYGKFGWILDGDGNKIELWEPKDEEHQFGKN